MASAADGGRSGDLRDHGRPGEGDDVPVALPARAARAARLPDRRRRRRRLERRPARGARARLDRRARASRSTRQCSPASPDGFPTSQATSRSPTCTRRSPKAIDGQAAAGLLPRDPAVPVRARRQGAPRRRPDRERAGRGREAVRPRPRVGPRACRRAPPVHRRVAALPDRPLPREDGLRRDPPAALRELAARAGLEPEPHRGRPDHDGRGLRRRGPRPLLRPGRRAARRRRQPSDAGRRRGRDGAAVARRSRDLQQREGLAVPRDQRGRPGALHPRPVRRLPVDRRRRPRLDHRDLCGAPARDRELALGRRAVLHPDRQAAPGHADRAPADLQPSAAARVRPTRRSRTR